MAPGAAQFITSCRRRNILVGPEEIGGIVLVFQDHQPLIFLGVIGRFDPVGAFVTQEVDVYGPSE